MTQGSKRSRDRRGRRDVMGEYRGSRTHPRLERGARAQGSSDEQDEELIQANPLSLRATIRRTSRRLGPKGRFLSIAIVIGLLLTGGNLFYERLSHEVTTHADTGNEAQVSLGRTLYMTNCAYCHGGDLRGQEDWDGNYPDGGRPAMPLNGEGAVWRLSDRDLFDVTKFGGQPFSPAQYKNDMPGFERELSDADIWAVLAYVKSVWPAEVVERQREAEAARERN